jgi:hypothetical protein
MWFSYAALHMGKAHSNMWWTWEREFGTAMKVIQYSSIPFFSTRCSDLFGLAGSKIRSVAEFSDETV